MADTIQFPEGMSYEPNPSFDDKIMLRKATGGDPVYSNVDDFMTASASQILGTATPSSSPTGSETNGQSYRVSSSDTDQVFTNFLDAGGVAITVPSPDSGLLTKSEGSWSFVKDGQDLSGLTPNGGYTGTSNDLANLKLNASAIGKEEGVNLFNPASIIPGKLLLCPGSLSNDPYGDAVTGFIDGLEGDTDYYIQGRINRTSLRFYDINGVGLAATNGADFCSGPANGLYHSPIGAYRVVFSLFWNGAGAAATDVMFSKGSTALPFVPYVTPIITDILDAPLGADLVKDRESEYNTLPNILDKEKDDTFVITPGSANLFDKDSMIDYGHSINQNTGATLVEANSMCTTRIKLIPGETKITIAGRSNGSATTGTNSGIIFFPDETSGRIASPPAPAYGGDLNRTVDIPSGAAYISAQISYLNTADGNKDTMMIVYGDSAPAEYIPYKPAFISGIVIEGVTYPLASGGVNPGTSSYKFQGVRWDGTELSIVSKYSDAENLLTVFKHTGNNNTFLPNGQWLISRDNDAITDADFDKPRITAYATTRWFGTDGVSPYSVAPEPGDTQQSVGFEGGNHLEPDPSSGMSPNYQTSNTVNYEIWVDGIKLNIGDRADAKVISVKVLNEVYNAYGFFEDPIIQKVDFQETQTSHVINGQLNIKVELQAMRNLTLKTVFGLQMQLGDMLSNIYFPHSQYNAVDPASVNPASGDRGYGTLIDYRDFEKFFAINGDNTKATCVWINTSVGLGLRTGYMNSTSQIARGKLGKLYHNLVAKDYPMVTGQTIFYEGIVTPFLNKSNTPASNTFSYYQYEKGVEAWEYDQYLYLDFAGTVSGRSILVDYPELVGKTLEVVKKDDTVTLPASLTVTEAGITFTNTGHGNIKLLIP